MGSEPEIDLNIGRVRLIVSGLDLFEIAADSIVNSDQSDFILAPEPETISGQIRERLGSAIQDELDQATAGQVLPAGSVIATSGGAGSYRSVFHIGFHEPWSWLEGHSSEVETDFINTIAQSVGTVLNDMDRSTVGSVAFPLIGTGLFQLDPQLLAYDFGRSVAKHASLATALPKTVFLSIQGKNNPGTLTSSVLQGVVDSFQGGSLIEGWTTGVGLVDDYAAQNSFAAGEVNRCWLLTRYAEIVLSYMCYRIMHFQRADTKTTFADGRALTFGRLRKLIKTILESEPPPDPWCVFYHRQLAEDLRNENRTARINDDRNNIAHGQSCRSADTIAEDIAALMAYQRWQELRDNLSDPGERKLEPWIARTPGGKYGVLQRIEKERLVYLVPASGSTYSLDP